MAPPSSLSPTAAPHLDLLFLSRLSLLTPLPRAQTSRARHSDAGGAEQRRGISGDPSLSSKHGDPSLSSEHGDPSLSSEQRWGHGFGRLYNSTVSVNHGRLYNSTVSVKAMINRDL
jgi:hypothetical protein